MNNRTVFIEPSIIGYDIAPHLPTKNLEDLPKIKDFVFQLKEVIEIISRINLKVIVSEDILNYIYDKFPNTYYEYDNILNNKLKIISKELHIQLQSIFTRNAKRVKINPICNISNDFADGISEYDDYYLQFLEMLISGCDNNGQTTSNLILKDINSAIFNDDSFDLNCNSDCGKEFVKKFECKNYIELYDANKAYIAEEELIKSITFNGIDIIARQNDHSPVFSKKIQKFEDIDQLERDLFVSLNKIVKIHEIIIREYIGITSVKEVALYDWIEMDERNSNNKRIKASLSLVQRTGKPSGCKVEIILDKDSFIKLENYMKEINQKIITCDFIEEILHKC